MLDSRGERSARPLQDQVVEYYVAYGDGTARAENREIGMLACIKADVLRLFVIEGDRNE